MNNISASILAGGKSKRFGRDKLLYIYKGKPLIEHVIDVVIQIIKEVNIVSDDRERLKYLGFPIIPDIIPNIGPLGGIFSTLNYSNTKKVFVFACDMPHLNAEFIEYMISISQSHEIIVPFVDNNYEALHAIYSRKCLRHIKNHIANGERRIVTFFDKVDVRRVYEEEINRYSDASLIFKNINYIGDIEE